MKAGDIYTEKKTEREKELEKLSKTGITKRNILALEKRKGGKKRRSKTSKRKTRR